jgi:hypothetical protein
LLVVAAAVVVTVAVAELVVLNQALHLLLLALRTL